MGLVLAGFISYSFYLSRGLPDFSTTSSPKVQGKGSLVSLGQVFTQVPINCKQGDTIRKMLKKLRRKISPRSVYSLNQAAWKPSIFKYFAEKGREKGEKKKENIIQSTFKSLIFPRGHESLSSLNFLALSFTERERPEVIFSGLGKQELGMFCRVSVFPGEFLLQNSRIVWSFPHPGIQQMATFYCSKLKIAP